MTRAAFSFATLALLASLAMPESARAYCQLTTSNAPLPPGTTCDTRGLPLVWMRRCPSYAVDRRGAIGVPMADLRAALDRSASKWTDVTCTGGAPGFIVMQVGEAADCDQADFNPRRGNVSVVAFINDWRERDLDPAAFAVTKVWHDSRTGEILDADILVNQTIRPWAVCDSEGCVEDPVTHLDPVDVENVLTHEFGHFFGLAHSTDPEATMYATTSRGELSKRALGSDDVAGFCAAYPAGSLTGTCDLSFFGGDDLTCGSGNGGCSAVPYAQRAPWLGALALAALVIPWARRRARR